MSWTSEPTIEVMGASARASSTRPATTRFSVSTEAWLKEIVEHQTRFAGRAVQQTYHVDFFNQHGDLVAGADSWCFRTERDHAREKGTKYKELRQKPVRRYTDEELADAGKLYAEEKIRGAEKRYWEDVKEGEALPTMVKGGTSPLVSAPMPRKACAPIRQN